MAQSCSVSSQTTNYITKKRRICFPTLSDLTFWGHYKTASDPAIFCFTNVDAASEFIRFIGWQILADLQVIDIDCGDVIKALGSQRGNILCISKKILIPQEELSAQDVEAQGVLLIFRGDEQLSMYEVYGQAEKLSRSLHESTNIIWTIEMCHEWSVTALLAKRLSD